MRCGNIFTFAKKYILRFFFTLYCFHLSAEQYSNAVKVYTDPKVYILFIFFSIFCFCILIGNIQNKKKIKNFGITDELTGLPTTRKLKIDLKKILLTAKPNEYTIISLDINSYRYIIESFGQDVGNSILIALSRHIESVIPKGSILCHNFVDNFYIVVHTTFLPALEDIVFNITNVDEALSNLLPKHFKLDFSVGICEINNPKENIESLMEKANTARETGKTSFNPKRLSVFTESMQSNRENEREIIFDMDRALKENEFIVYYQPKFSLSDGKVVGAEALVRWNHKTRGLLTPGYFIPFFEKNGFIQNIDILVFESCCKFLDNWNKSQKNPVPITISCNLSRLQLYNPDLANKYANIASKYQIAPSNIEIELTESLMMDNKDRLLKAMHKIKNAGFTISVDDFGSGFSSLSLLKDIPANVLKLDREFLNSNRDNEKEKIIIHSVINMAKELDMQTVAEGVEDQKQSDLLKNMGCDIVQGFFYAKPMPEVEFNNLLKNAFA